MKKNCAFVLSSFFLGVSILLSVSVLAQVSPSLKFIENKNQWHSQVDYAARVPGGRLFLSPGQFSIYLFDQRLHEHHAHGGGEVNEAEGKLAEDEPIDGHYVQISFLNANNLATPVASKRSKEYYNYFLGNDSSRWASHAYAYAEVMYSSLYNGVDLKISSVNEHLKYDFIVKPDSDPSQIRVEYCGADQLSLDYGDLSIETSVGKLVERKPYSYQLIDGVKREVRSEYQLEGNVLTFNFPDGYDPCFDLTIDPLLIFSTFSGSTADNWGSTATPGESGTLYSSGITNEETHLGKFPATPGAFQTTYGGSYDIAILKYDSTGSQMLYASYLGGTSNETPHSLVMDESTKDLLVLGTTSSVDFPFTFGALDNTFNGGVGLNTYVISYPSGSDMVISRISQDGSVLLGSTFLGGSSNDGVNPAGPLVRNYGDNMRGDIITNEQGDIFISSVTGSTDFPAVNSFNTVYRGGVTDAVLLKIKGDLSAIEWSAFLGGSAYDASHTLKFDGDGNLFIGGGTTSSDFPVTLGVYQSVLTGDADGWIAHIQENGASVLHATFTGTVGFDQVYFVDLNTEGEVYVYGQTNGNMPVTPGVYSNPNSGQFVQKFSSDLSALVFSTVFGSGIGIPNISPTAFLVNDCNNLYMSGWGGNINISRNYWPSTTHNMPTTPDALQRTTQGSDFYFMVLTDDATELLYATYLGGTISSTHVDGGTSRFDKSGIVYHAVCGGCGNGYDDFPTTPGAWSRTNDSDNCNNAAFKFDLSSLRARLQTNSVAFDIPGLDQICYPDTIRFQNFSTGGEFYEWDLGDGTTFTKQDTTSFLHQYQQGGVYLVKLKAIDQNTCIGIDSTSKNITVFANNSKAQEDDDICFGTSYSLQASGGITYNWSTQEDGALPSNLVNPEDTTQYFVIITDGDGCVKRDTVVLNVVPEIDLKLEYEVIADCFSRPALLLRNNTKGDPDDTFFFDFGDGFISDAEEVTHHYEQDGEYVIKLVGVKEFCMYDEQFELPFFTTKVPNVITPDLTSGLNDAFVIQYGELGQTPADIGLKVTVSIVNRWGKNIFESGNYQNDWMAKEVEAGIYYYQVTIGDHATCKGWVQVIK
jgi:hypothetical protein